MERLREAARAALAAGAPSSAAELLGRALREPPPAEERAALLVELGRAEAAAGDAGAPERLREAVTLTAEPGLRAERLRDLGQLLYLTGQPAEAASAFERGLADLAQAGDPDPSLRAELQAGWLTVARIVVPLRARAAELMHEIAERPPDPDTYGERALLAQLAGQLTFEGEPRERALELARLALGDGDLIRAETSDGLSWVAAMGALGWGDDFEAYEAAQEIALEDARRRGSVIGFATASYGNSFSNYYRGRLLDAIADAQQAIAAEREGWQHFLPAARAQLAWALIERGELDAAAAELRRARDDATWERSSMQALVLEAEARVHLARGHPDRALEAALEAGRVFDEAGILNPSIRPWRAGAAVAAAQLGERERAEELIADGLERARRYGAPRPIGVALVALGLVRGDGSGLESLEEAVGVLAASPARIEHARALVLHGAALRRARRVAPARDVLRRGLDQCADLGALALERLAAGELRAAGARLRRRRISGAEALTPSELRVAELAARCMSNREVAEALFVSLRTVETHLTHVYRKLEIDSRSGLAAALGRSASRPPSVPAS